MKAITCRYLSSDMTSEHLIILHSLYTGSGGRVGLPSYQEMRCIVGLILPSSQSQDNMTQIADQSPSDQDNSLLLVCLI